jgi:hypothetical protein
MVDRLTTLVSSRTQVMALVTAMATVKSHKPVGMSVFVNTILTSLIINNNRCYWKSTDGGIFGQDRIRLHSEHIHVYRSMRASFRVRVHSCVGRFSRMRA